MKIAHRIKEAMKDNDMTQADLSRISGISKSTLSEWISGKYEPKQNNIYILSKALKVNPTWLMGLEVQKEIKEDISLIYDRLETKRQRRVYDFADLQLKQQNGELEQNNILIAAHSKEDLTDDERQQINDFIDKIRKEKRK